MRDWNGKTLVLTGGAGALALPVARTFQGLGARVVLVDVPSDRLAARAEALGVTSASADLTRMAETTALFQQLEDEGPVHGVIHTVGAWAMGELSTVDPAQYDALFDLNVKTLFHVVRAAVPAMRQRREGFVAGVSATPAKDGASPGQALYGAAKSAVAHLMRSLEGELTGTDVHAFTLYVMGTIDTDANRAAMPDQDPARWIAPEALADALAFAATRDRRGTVRELAVYPPRG